MWRAYLNILDSLLSNLDKKKQLNPLGAFFKIFQYFPTINS